MSELTDEQIENWLDVIECATFSIDGRNMVEVVLEIYQAGYEKGFNDFAYRKDILNPDAK